MSETGNTVKLKAIWNCIVLGAKRPALHLHDFLPLLYYLIIGTHSAYFEAFLAHKGQVKKLKPRRPKPPQNQLRLFIVIKGPC